MIDPSISYGSICCLICHCSFIDHVNGWSQYLSSGKEINKNVLQNIASLRESGVPERCELVQSLVGFIKDLEIDKGQKMVKRIKKD